MGMVKNRATRSAKQIEAYARRRKGSVIPIVPTKKHRQSVKEALHLTK